MEVLRTLGFCALATAAATGCSFTLDDDYSSGPGSSSSGSSGSSGETGQPGSWGRPAEGVYTYDATGRDRIEGVVNVSNPYGPTARVRVAHRGASCFALTVDLRDGYDETMDMCVRGAEVVQGAGVRSQDFLGISATTNLTCTPGDVYLAFAPSPDQTWAHDCGGKNLDQKSGNSAFKTAGPYRFVGKETVSVGGQDTSVMHYHDERNVTGSQTGDNVADWYFATSDGLLVRLTRDIDIEYRAPIIGLVHYTEHVEMTLTTTSPEPLPDAGAVAPTDASAENGSK